MFHIGMFKIHLRTKFHMHFSNGSLVIAMKLKAKYRFHTAHIVLFYVLQNIKFTNVAYFFGSLLPYVITRH
jgi:hypothetical protein